MVALFLTTTISCNQILGMVNRVQKAVGLSEQQKIEIIQEVRKFIPSCPIIIKSK